VCVINAASSQLIEVVVDATVLGCNVTDPGFLKCLLDEIESIIPDLPIDPLNLPELAVDVQVDANVTVDLKDVDINNLTQAKVLSVSYNLLNNSIDITLDTTALVVAGNFDVNANVLGSPIIANGSFSIGLGPSTSVVSISLSPITVNGGIDLGAESIVWTFTDLKLSVQVETNVIDEVQLLKTTTIEALDKAVNDVLTQLVPAIESALDKALLKPVQEI